MEYIKRRFTRAKLSGNKVRIHPLCCWHVGATQSDLRWIEQTIDEIRQDPAARWVYCGDGGECVTKLSKGNVFEQTLTPQQQADFLVHLLSPVKEKGLFGIRGNHGNRIALETGMSFDKSVMTALGVPYLGISALLNLHLNRSSYDLYFHHGAPSGVALQSKVNSAAKAYHILADIRVTGHSHVTMELPPEFYSYADNTAMRILHKPIHQVIAGCAYDSTVEGYAEEKLYSPIRPGRVIIELDGSISGGVPAHKVDIRVKRETGDNQDLVRYTNQRLREWLDAREDQSW